MVFFINPQLPGHKADQGRKNARISVLSTLTKRHFYNADILFLRGEPETVSLVSIKSTVQIASTPQSLLLTKNRSLEMSLSRHW